MLLCAGIVGADALIIRMDRAASIEDFRTATTNLANGMAAQTGRSLAGIDAVLRDVSRSLAQLQTPAAERMRAQAVSDLLGERLRLLAGTVASLAVVDADGRVASTEGETSAPGLAMCIAAALPQLRDRATQRSDPGVFVNQPTLDRVHGTWSTCLARRLGGPDESFAGAVLAQLPLAGLEDFYRNAMPVHRTVTLARRDGIVLVRYPHTDGATGRLIPAASPWHMAAAAGGSYVAPGYFDSVRVVAVVRPLQGLPLVIETSITEADALAGWRRQLVWLIIGGAAACLLTVLLLRAFAAQMRRLALQNVQLDTARRQLHVAMSNISQGLCFYDGAQRLIVCNQRYADMYRLPPHVMLPGTSLAEIVDHCFAAGGTSGGSRDEYLMSRAAIARAREPHHSVIEMADGRTISIQQQPMPDGGWVATHDDITARRRAEAQIAYLAQHDVLTGLPNRSLLHERIAQARVAIARGGAFAIQFLDLDRFKTVNDTLGHAAGDGLLRAVTSRLLATVREGDTVARLGGDEFVVLQAGVQAPEDAAILAQRIIKDIGAPYVIGGNDVVIGVSIGIDIALSDRVPAEDLLKNADMALYIAKAEGRGTFRFFAPEMDARVQNRHALERDLRCALERGEFELHYQPIVQAQSGKACGFEALLRWNHPARGVVSPKDFIAVAEETGLIIPIGAWVLQEACRQAAAWPQPIRVAVNLSAVQFRAADLVHVVKEALAAAGLAPNRLELEITESVLLQSNDRNIAVMHELRACGVAIVMDDFGVGYASLGYLRGFPFDRIKIDQSFVHDLTRTPHAVYFVRAIVDLCRNLGIRTTAEGVETAAQLAMLTAEGCTELQGYLFSPPRLAAEMAGAADGYGQEPHRPILAG